MLLSKLPFTNAEAAAGVAAIIASGTAAAVKIESLIPHCPYESLTHGHGNGLEPNSNLRKLNYSGANVFQNEMRPTLLVASIRKTPGVPLVRLAA